MMAQNNNNNNKNNISPRIIFKKIRRNYSQFTNGEYLENMIQ